MTLKEIAVKNLLRRKAKAAFILAGLVIGVATVVTIISFSKAMTHDINHKLEKYGANILIVPKTDNLALSYGGLSLGGVSFELEEIRQADLASIQSIKNYRNIAAIGPMVLGGVSIGEHRVLMAGVDFEAARILKPWWNVDGRLPRDSQVLLGDETARIFGVRSGSTLFINGKQHEISGVLSPTGSQDDQLLFARLETAQAVLNKSGTVSMVEVAALCTACPIDEMVQQLSGALPNAKVMAIQQVVKGRMETIAQFKKFSYSISAVVVMIGGLVVLVTLMGSVRERTEEIGIFRAIGFRRSDVMRIVFLEAAIVSSIAGLLGYGLGQGSTLFGMRLFFDNFSMNYVVDLPLAAASIIMAVLVGLAASAYPALMAARLDPNDALRSL